GSRLPGKAHALRRAGPGPPRHSGRRPGGGERRSGHRRAPALAGAARPRMLRGGRRARNGVTVCDNGWPIMPLFTAGRWRTSVRDLLALLVYGLAIEEYRDPLRRQSVRP